MTITNYTNLQSTIADFLNRDDLTSTIPVFVQLAESQLNRELRHWKMETRATATIDAGDQYSQVPGDWLETIRMSISDGNTSKVDQTSLTDLMDKREAGLNQVGRPRFYAHAGESFELYPTPNQTYNIELMYYQKIPALSASQTTNWLLDFAPDAYLYGSLVQASPYLGEDERVAVWNGLYNAAVASINAQNEKSRYSGSTLSMRLSAY